MKELLIGGVNKSRYKDILKVAVPASLEMVLQQVLGLIDTAFVSHMSDDKLAAVGLANQIYSLILILIAALATGTGVVVAQYFGANRMKDIKLIISNVVKIGTIIAVTLITIMYVSMHSIVIFMGAEPIVVGYVSEYWKVVVFALFFSVLTNFLASILRAMSNTKFPLYSNLAGVLSNTVLNYLFIFVFDMGVVGVAIATIVARGITFMILLVYYEQSKLFSLLHFAKEKIDKVVVKKVMVISVPILIGELAWAIGSFIYNSCYTRVGTYAIVAYQILFSAEEIFIMTAFGFTIAGFSMVAQYIGKEDIKGAIEEAKSILKCGRISSIGFGMLLIAFAWTLLPVIYSKTTFSSVRLAQIALTINACAQVIKVKNFILGNGILRSGGKTKYIMYIDIVATSSGIIVAIVSAFVLKYGFWGVFVGKLAEETVRYILMTIQFKSGRWINSVEGGNVGA